MGKCFVFFAVLVALVQIARADLQQYVDARTVLAAQADLTKVDPAALDTWLRQIMTAAGLTTGPFALKPQEVDRQMALMRKWIGDVVAAGGKEIDLVGSDDVVRGPDVALICPVAPGGDVNKIASLLFEGRPGGSMSKPENNRQAIEPKFNESVRVLNDNVAVLGSARSIVRIKGLKPIARPDIVEAIEALGNSPIKVVIAPTPSMRNLLITQLPPVIFDQSSSVVTQDVKWIAIGATPPMTATVNATVRATDAAKAQAFDHIATFGLAALSGVPPTISPDLAKMLTPVVKENELILSADNTKLLAIAKEVAPLLVASRRRAMMAESMSNERQILLACQMYANEHKGAWPDDLKAVGKYLGNSKAVMINPARPEMSPGYVYMKPASPRDRPSETAVLYESHKEFGHGVGVAFADGHCEFVSSKQRFDELIAKTAMDAGPQ